MSPTGAGVSCPGIDRRTIENAAHLGTWLEARGVWGICYAGSKRTEPTVESISEFGASLGANSLTAFGSSHCSGSWAVGRTAPEEI